MNGGKVCASQMRGPAIVNGGKVCVGQMRNHFHSISGWHKSGFSFKQIDDVVMDVLHSISWFAVSVIVLVLCRDPLPFQGALQHS